MLYVDESKRKYFRIEKSQTAPSSATWTTDTVKRRKIDDDARKAARRRAQLVKNHIRRHAIRREVVTGGLLAREMEHRLVAEAGMGRPADGDIGAATWVGGVLDKGHISFVPSFARSRFANMPCFYVGGQDCKTGLGVAYASEYKDYSDLKPMV